MFLCSREHELILLGEEAGNYPSLPPLLSDSPLIRPGDSALSKFWMKQSSAQWFRHESIFFWGLSDGERGRRVKRKQGKSDKPHRVIFWGSVTSLRNDTDDFLSAKKVEFMHFLLLYAKPHEFTDNPNISIWDACGAEPHHAANTPQTCLCYSLPQFWARANFSHC